MTVYKKTMQKYEEKTHPDIPHEMEMPGSTFISYERYFYIFAMMPLVSSRNLTMMLTSLPSGT